MKKTNNEGRIKKKYKKVKVLELKVEDKNILDATVQKLEEIVKKEIEDHINNLVKRVDEINSKKSANTEGNAEKNSTKKNIVLKIRKYKKYLTDEAEIKKRVNMLKMKRRKLSSKVERFQDKIVTLAKKSLRCFKCRKRGHTIEDCKGDDEEKGDDEPNKEDVVEKKEKPAIKKTPAKILAKILCYNCGSNEHSIHTCNIKVDYANLPFADCFICKMKGHLSANCPQSDKGIYIRGGACFICKGKDHLAKNCPERQIQMEQNEKLHEMRKQNRLNKSPFSDNRRGRGSSNRGRGGSNSRGRGFSNSRGRSFSNNRGRTPNDRGRSDSNTTFLKKKRTNPQ
jgi:hypothetical protein